MSKPTDFLRERTWQVEPEWCERHDDGFSHWPFRLRQRITHEDLGDGFIRWSAATEVVSEIRDLESALSMCQALNRHAAGWSYVVHEQSRTIEAIATAVIQPEWEQPYARWVGAATVGFWHADVIADELARSVRGATHVSHPRDAEQGRDVPDGMFQLVRSERARPEWVFDPIQERVDLVALGSQVASWIGAEGGDSSTRTQVCVDGVDKELLAEAVAAGTAPRRVPPNARYRVTAEFVHREPFGAGFLARIRFPLLGGRTVPDAWLANQLALDLAGQWSLAGAWSVSENAVSYEIFVPSFTLRMMRTGSSHEQTLESLLLNVVGGLSGAMSVVDTAGQAGPEAAPLNEDATTPDLAAELLAVFEEPAREALAGIPNPTPDRADRRWLTARPFVDLCLYGIFSPMGPTLASLVLIEVPGDEEFAVVHMMRHPLLPKYKELGRVRTEEDVRDLISSQLPDELGSMPEFLLVNARGSLGDAAHAGLRQALSRHAGTVDDDLIALATEYRHYNGRAWDRLNKTDAAAERATESAGTGPFEDWLSAVTELDHVYGTLLSLPTAWDGAIKFQSEQGTLSHFDME